MLDQSTPAELSVGTRTVLIVGADPSLTEWIATELARDRRYQLATETTADPVAAMRRLGQQRFDAIVFDAVAAGDDGLPAIERLRYTPLAPALLALTRDEDACDAAVRAGAAEALPRHCLNSCILRRVVRYAMETQESRHRFEALVAQSVDGMIILDRDGRIIYLNAAAARYLGADAPDQLLGTEFGIPAVVGTWTEVTLSCGNIAEMRVHAVAPEDQDAVAVSLRDITHRVAAEEALRASEANYRDLVENQPQIIHRFLPDTTETFVNKAYERFFGMSGEEILNTRWADRLPPEERGPALTHLATYSPEVPVQVFENTSVRHDGAPRWTRWTNRAFFDVDGRATHFQSVGVDVTEEVAAQRRLTESEARFRAIFERAALGIVIADTRGRALQVNPAMAEMLGQKAAALHGVDLTSFASDPGDRAELRGLLEQIRLDEPIPQQIERQYRRADGRLVWARINASRLPEHTHRGEPCVLALVEDITEAKEAERAVRGVNRRLDLLLSSVSEGIYGLDQDGNVTFANPAAQRMLQRSAQDLLGQNMHTLIHYRQRDGSPYPFEQCPIYRTLRHGRATFVDDDMFWREDGTGLEVSYSINPILNETGAIEGAVVVFQDVTERRAIERQNAATLERLELATDAAGIGVWEWDANRQRFIWDDQMLRIYGFTREGFTGAYEEWFEAVHPDDREQVAAAVEELVSRPSGQRQQREFRIRRPDGAIRHIRAAGQPEQSTATGERRVVGLNWDITETREVESSLQREKSFSDHIVTHSPHLVVSVAVDGTTLFLNRAAEFATGYDQRELIGLDWWRTLYPEADDDQVRALFDRIRGDEQILDHPMTLTRKDGEQRIISWSFLTRTEASGALTEIVGYGRDITAERAQQAQQQQEDKLRALGEMAGGMAHEINNALQPIVGMVGLLGERVGEYDAKLGKRLDTMEQHALYARKIVSDVLAFARMEGPEVTEHAIAEVMADVVGFVDRVTPSRVQIVKEGFSVDGESDRAGPMMRVRLNRNGLIQVLQNLISNATDALGGAGTVTVRLAVPSPAERTPDIPGPQVRIDVADAGPGMDEATKRNLFDPFFSTKPVGKGTGLGLSVVYGLVTHWGGSVRVDSEPGEGTTVRIYLPVVRTQG